MLHLRSSEDGDRLVTVCTHVDLIVLPVNCITADYGQQTFNAKFLVSPRLLSFSVRVPSVPDALTLSTLTSLSVGQFLCIANRKQDSKDSSVILF